MKSTEYLVDGVRFRGGKRVWNVEDDAQLRAIYPHASTKEVATTLHRSISSISGRATKLGLNKSAEYLASPAACRLRRGDQVGLAFRYPKGHVPANKGTRRPGYSPGRMRETQFKKGERSGIAVKVWKPIGTERLSKDGYLERKINNDLPLQARWRSVHLLMWEAVHGPLPRSHAIAFLNGNKRDLRMENFELITRAQLMRRNSVHNLPQPVKQVVQLLGAVNRQIRRRSA